MADRRVRKTKEALKNSLFTILTQKPINRITVKEIVELADINRSTFYKYYLDTSDMLEKIEEEIYQQFISLIDENLKKKEQNKINSETLSLDFIADICTIAKENQAFCKCIFSDYGDISFLNRLYRLIEENTKELLNELYQKDYQEGLFLYSFIKAGLVGVLRRWLENDFAETPEEISAITYNLIKALIANSIINKDSLASIK